MARYADALLAIHLHARRMAAFHERFDIVPSPTPGQALALLGPQHMSNPGAAQDSAALLRFTPFANLFNMSGEPTMSVPLHWTADGLPVGVMFSAGFGREDLLFRLAAQLKVARPWVERMRPLAP